MLVNSHEEAMSVNSHEDAMLVNLHEEALSVNPYSRPVRSHNSSPIRVRLRSLLGVEGSGFRRNS